ncbi:phosphatidate cytidylyltransferase, mitochondrial-like [Convolutriloba macropyga]|uniref:phosphatidate cytidylyltransferase, mitochondrial-like n=1 Tax=Convolutriloba macropyga TaxID=536237 RepID=UPI003F527BC0
MSSAKLQSLVFEKIMERFDLASNLKLMFAYGSAVFKQKGNLNSKNMVDVCFVVNDTSLFHSKNLNRNPRDYSLIGKLGSGVVNHVQNMPCGVYFNTLVKLDAGVMFKYGVVSSPVLERDLSTWDALYYSGRLHKPVSFIYPPDTKYLESSELNSLLNQNLKAAWNAAVLISSQNHRHDHSATSSASLKLRDVLVSICGLSYNGDFRMIFGEDKQKVVRIVDSSWEPLCSLYEPFLKSDPFLHSLSHSQLEVDLSPEAIEYRISQLPERFRRFDSCVNGGEERPDLATVSRKLCKELEATVWRSSVLQSMKNAITAGVMKSSRYSLQKLNKMANSMK